MMGGKQLVNRVLVLLVIAAVAGAALGGLWLLPPGDADASGHSANRSFSKTSVAPGETVTVRVTAMDYGRVGRIVETLPSGSPPRTTRRSDSCRRVLKPYATPSQPWTVPVPIASREQSPTNKGTVGP